MAMGRVSGGPATAPLAVAVCFDSVLTTLMPRLEQSSEWSRDNARTGPHADELRHPLRSPSRHAVTCVLSRQSKEERRRVSTAVMLADRYPRETEQLLERVRREISQRADDKVAR